jgi:hypothetical protein
VCEGAFRYFFQCGPANSAICIPDVGVANPDGTIGLVVAGPKAGKVHRLPAAGCPWHRRRIANAATIGQRPVDAPSAIS